MFLFSIKEITKGNRSGFCNKVLNGGTEAALKTGELWDVGGKEPLTLEPGIPAQLTFAVKAVTQSSYSSHT